MALAVPGLSVRFARIGELFCLGLAAPRRFNGLTLLAYLNYTLRIPRRPGPQLLIAGPGVARVPSRMPTVQADGVEVGEADSLAVAAVSD